MADLTCQEFVELVTDYLEGALDEDTVRRFEEHMDLCQGCETYLSQMKETASRLGRSPSRASPRDAGHPALRLPRLPSLTFRPTASPPSRTTTGHRSEDLPMPDVEFTNLLAVTLIALLAPPASRPDPRAARPRRRPGDHRRRGRGTAGPGLGRGGRPGLDRGPARPGVPAVPRRVGGRRPPAAGQVLRLAVLGYLATVALGLCVGLGLDAAGWVDVPAWSPSRSPPPHSAWSCRS
jgi:hypothetical protein